MVTSHADRTSPVVRGKWILDNLLGAPPPLPPMNVPPLPDDERSGRQRVLSVREKIETAPGQRGLRQLPQDHGSRSGWRSRTSTRWGPTASATVSRSARSGTPIDASGQLMDGTPVDGVVTLRKALLKDPEIFVGALTEKLLTYAMGRGVAYYDMPTVRGDRARRQRANYSFAIARVRNRRSAPFQMRMKSCGVGAWLRRPRPDVSQGFVNPEPEWRRSACHVHHEEVTLPSSDAARSGRHRRPAVSRCDGAGADRQAKTAANPVRRFGTVFVGLGERPRRGARPPTA